MQSRAHWRISFDYIQLRNACNRNIIALELEVFGVRPDHWNGFMRF